MANPTVSNRQVLSGNLVVIQFETTTIGIAQTARFSGDFGLTDESGIGDNLVKEYVPGIAHINVSLSGLVLLKENIFKAMNTLGVGPKTSASDILTGKVFDIAVMRQTTLVQTTGADAWLIKATNCSLASMDVSIGTGRAVTYDCSFRAQDISGLLVN